MFTEIEDFSHCDQELLRKEKWLIHSIDDKNSFPMQNFHQEGRYHLYHLYNKKNEEKTDEVLAGYDIVINKSYIQYSLNLGEEYMSYIHSAAEKDKYNNYIPSKYMYKKMFYTSEILFYSNPANCSINLYELRMGQTDSNWSGNPDVPLYKFGESNDLVGVSEIREYSVFCERILTEIEDMLNFVYFYLLPEMENLSSVMFNSLMRHVSRNFLKGVFKGALKGISGWF